MLFYFSNMIYLLKYCLYYNKILKNITMQSHLVNWNKGQKAIGISIQTEQ